MARQGRHRGGLRRAPAGDRSCIRGQGRLRLLLDTHVLLWWLADSPVLSEDAAAAIGEPSNEVMVSAASAWEIAIKRALGKLPAPEDLESAVDASGFERLAISFEHARVAGSLPPHHADPFDRMLVAQAQAESMTIVTSDPRIDRYSVHTLAAT